WSTATWGSSAGPVWPTRCSGVSTSPRRPASSRHHRAEEARLRWALLAVTPRALAIRPLGRFATLHELPEGLGHRVLLGKDVEHPALLERRAHHALVEVGCHVDAAVGDTVVFRRGRRQALGAPFRRDAGRGRMDRDR